MENEITPEYIVEQISILTTEELIELIYAYGRLQHNIGSELASDDY